jgi:hypothetical protein
MQSGRVEYRDVRPALLTCPSQKWWLGPFCVRGSNEQIFGVNGQIFGQDQSDQRASARPWWWHRPTDAEVIAGTILGIANMAIYGRRW